MLLFYEAMGSGTHHFDVLQSVFSRRHRIGLRIDVWHVAPVAYPCTITAGRSVDIAEDESEDISTIDHCTEVIDVG